MIQRHLIVLCLALTVALAGCVGTSSTAVTYTPEDLGLDPLDQVIPMATRDHQSLDNEFLAYLRGVQEAGDDANWQAKPYDHYMAESAFK